MIIIPTHPETRSALLSWLANRVGYTPDELVYGEPYSIIGVVRGNAIQGVVMYNNWRGRSIETHWAGEGAWLTRAVLRAVFGLPFQTYGCRRITGLIRRKNRVARAVAERIGFRLEGVARQGFDDGTDAMIYGMVRDECRWLT